MSEPTGIGTATISKVTVQDGDGDVMCDMTVTGCYDPSALLCNFAATNYLVPADVASSGASPGQDGTLLTINGSALTGVKKVTLADATSTVVVELVNVTVVSDTQVTGNIPYNAQISASPPVIFASMMLTGANADGRPVQCTRSALHLSVAPPV